MKDVARPIVFVCGTPHGGAVDSTAALVNVARAAGHPVTFIVSAVDAYTANRRLSSLLVRLCRRAPRVGALAWRAYEHRYGRVVDSSIGGVQALRTVDVVGAVRRCVEPGSIVVANSLRRVDLERLVELTASSEATFVWYLREESSLAAADAIGPQVDVLLANSRPLAVAATERSGRRCGYVPSVITVDDLVEPADRSTILVVNAVQSYGLDEALRIAAAMSDRRVVLQESWPLSDADVAALAPRLATLPNAELRRRCARAEVFRDASVMLLPHSGSAVGLHRPRVALEAQFLGVPIIAYDTAGLAAVAASPELLVPAGASTDEWVRRIRTVESDYERFADAARAFAAAELQGPTETWNRFVEAVGQQ